MQRASTPLAPISATPTSCNTHNHNPASTAVPRIAKPTFMKLSMALLTASVIGLTGCQTIKDFTGSDDSAIATAQKTDAAYYRDAVKSLDKGNYLDASEQLAELRTFYPTGPYAEQALLDLMYSQYKSGEYELAAGSAEQFIKLYPRNVQVDYAYYVRGVSNMQAGNNTLLNLAKLNPAHRDTAYLRLAFSNFQDLIALYPNSAYAPDASMRMRHIYNQFAESELTAARWYIKRDAYVAAANRAKWVFQYYPLSEQTPEAIAILAYTNQQLGLSDLANNYKTLLQINYPNWLFSNGKVKLNVNRSSSLLNILSFGTLGRADQRSASLDTTGTYNGATKTQVVEQAAHLQLPEDDTAASKASFDSLSEGRRRGFGLGLPQEDAEQITAPASTEGMTQSARVSPQTMYADSQPVGDANQTRRTTVPVADGPVVNDNGVVIEEPNLAEIEDDIEQLGLEDSDTQ